MYHVYLHDLLHSHFLRCSFFWYNPRIFLNTPLLLQALELTFIIVGAIWQGSGMRLSISVLLHRLRVIASMIACSS